LLLAGDLLHEPRFTDAALQVARGMAQSQLSAGKIPTMPLFAASAGGREEPAIIPDRASTCAAMGLFLAIVDHQAATSQPSGPKDRADRAANRAATWMIGQQTQIGGWPRTFPVDANPTQAQTTIRVLRLDDPDYRNSCLAMLLAADVLNDKGFAHSNERMISFLMLLRRDDPQARGNGLWFGAYKPTGAPDSKEVELPTGPDAVASRNAMQVLMARYLLSSDKNIGMTLDSAALTLAALRKTIDGKDVWDRYVDHPESALPTLGESDLGDHGLADLLASTTQLRTVGRERYLNLMNANFTLRQHIAATLVGLNEQPFTLDMPVSAKEVNSYLTQNALKWKCLEGEPPSILPEFTKRLWVLLLRAKVEKIGAS
jgi:hypothetical protein